MPEQILDTHRTALAKSVSPKVEAAAKRLHDKIRMDRSAVLARNSRACAVRVPAGCDAWVELGRDTSASPAGAAVAGRVRDRSFERAHLRSGRVAFFPREGNPNEDPPPGVANTVTAVVMSWLRTVDASSIGMLVSHKGEDPRRPARDHPRAEPVRSGPGRIGAWRTSFSGAHVFVVAAIDYRVEAMVGQTPFVSGRATYANLARVDNQVVGPERFTADRRARADGKAAASVPVIGADPGELVALPTPDSYERFICARAELEPSRPN